jgi:integrase
MWHFRLVVPRDLRPVLGLRVIKRSLGTRDPAHARLWAYTLGAHYVQLFAKARCQEQGMRKQWWDEERKVWTDFEQRAPPKHSVDGARKVHLVRGGPDPSILDYSCEVRADGSARIQADGPEDHARAMEALERTQNLRALHAAVPVPPLAATVAASAPTHRHTRAAGKAVDQWLKSIEADTLKKTLTIKAAAVNSFAGHFGKTKPIHEATWDDVHAWVEVLKFGGLQTPTLVNKCSYLRGFFDWATQMGYVAKRPKDENLAIGHVIFGKREKVKRRAFGFKAFTLEQVQALYSPAVLATLSEGARWGAVIGLYTGARVSEVGQLTLADFTTVDGVPCLTITDEGEGQSVKNEASRRTIPVHPDLLTLGLMERVERLRKEGETRLFPKVKVGAVNGAGNWLSKAFTRHIEAMGITKPAKGKYGFHSLRKTAIQTMKSAKVPLEWRCAYVGHDLDEEHVETYSGEYGPREMFEMVAPGLEWGLVLSSIRTKLAT